MKKFVRVMTAILALAVAAGTAQAAGSPVLDRVVESGQLRVGMSGTQPPYNVVSRDGALIGLEVDLANLIASGLRVELKIVRAPFGDLLKSLEQGKVDMVMSGMSITARRSQRATFVGPYMLSGKSILTRSSVLAAARDAGEIDDAKLTLAALENSTSEDYVQTMMSKSKLVAVKDYDDAVKLLLDGEVDALVADMAICLLTILRYPDSGLTTLKEPFTFEPIGIAVPADDPQFRNLIDNFVDTAENIGALEKMREKWLRNSAWVVALP
ncbi:MAG: transporter substrate-binding domain-containing protein [Gammaproteobacteria bacterium]|jgi:polar amino acid transport system substrate-binding protein